MLVAFGFIAGAVIVEIFLDFFPVSTGYRFLSVNQNNPILRGTPGFSNIYSKGWNMRLATSVALNNYGYPVGYDYDKISQNISVIGDSYIQAAAINSNDKFYALLDEQLKPRHMRVYGLGMSGASLADYLAHSKWALDEFHSKSIVILLTKGDLQDSVHVRAGGHYIEKMGDGYHLRLTDNPRNLMKVSDVLLKSSLLRYLMDNLTFSYNFLKLSNQGEATARSVCQNPDKSEPDVTRFLLNEFKQLSQDKGVTVQFMIDPANRGSQPVSAACERDIDRFAKAAEEAGFPIIRLEQAFRQEATKTGLRLDFTPVDHHWNSRAHRVAAQQILETLRN